MILLVTDIVLIITGFQLILLSGVILRQKDGNFLNRFLLVAFLLSKAFLVLRWFSLRFIFTYDDLPYFYTISLAGFFLLAPLLYLYIRSLCYKNFTLKKSTIIHFLPFFLMMIFLFFDAYIQLTKSNNDLSVLDKFILTHDGAFFWTSNFIQILFYLVAMFHTANDYKSKIKNQYSYIDKINLDWLFSLLIVISLHWLFIVSRAMLSLLSLNIGALVDLLDLFSITIFLFYTTFLVIEGVNRLKVFSGIEWKPKYGNARLPESEIRQIIQKLKNYIKIHKPYLNPSLTIDDLSQKLSVPSWQLSQVINDSFNLNFFNFINRYRIEEVKNKFKDPAHHHETVLQILYESGFNSKSTFNNVFKKFTGMTPVEFKRSNGN